MVLGRAPLILCDQSKQPPVAICDKRGQIKLTEVICPIMPVLQEMDESHRGEWGLLLGKVVSWDSNHYTAEVSLNKQK